MTDDLERKREILAFAIHQRDSAQKIIDRLTREIEELEKAPKMIPLVVAPRKET